MYENTAEKTGSSANKRPVCSGVVYFCAIGCITNPKALHTNASSANKSTLLQPVSQVASGGEIARVMLSLKEIGRASCRERV